MTTELDMAYVQAQFPGLASDWVFFDNAGGAQIAKPALDRMVEFLTHRNVQIGGSYAVSQSAAEALMTGRRAAATLVNAARPEEIVFGPSTTVLMGNLMQAMRRQFQPGDEVIVHDAPAMVPFGTQHFYYRRATVVRAGPMERLRARLAGYLELTELYEVGFSEGRTQ